MGAREEYEAAERARRSGEQFARELAEANRQGKAIPDSMLLPEDRQRDAAMNSTAIENEATPRRRLRDYTVLLGVGIAVALGAIIFAAMLLLGVLGSVSVNDSDLDCADIDGTVAVSAGDPHRLDGDGIGCEQFE